MNGKIRRAEDLYYGESRALSVLEIMELIKNYAQAAKRAIEAGFDGVEIHGANGYLIDQFLHYHTNLRQDVYGQSPENMALFALELIDACITEIGQERVGLRLSPGAYLNEIVGDKRDAKVFQYLLEQLNTRNIAYVHTGNFDDSILFPELENKTMTQFMRTHYQGTLIASGGYNLEKATHQIEENSFDLIAIGRPFIANPDLITRVKNKNSLIPYDGEMLKVLN